MNSTRTLPLLLGIALAATVALPAATALQLASQGTAAANAAWQSAGGLDATAPCCAATTGVAGSGAMQTSATWNAGVKADEQAVIDQALAAKAKAEADAKAALDAAMKLKERVNLSLDYDAEVRGDMAMDSEAKGSAGIGVDGLIHVGGGKKVEVKPVVTKTTEVKADAKAKVEATGDSALAMLAKLLGDVQGQITAGLGAAVDATADAGSQVGEALGLVQKANVDLHGSLDVAGSLGGVGSIEVPQVRAPSLALDGAASAAASAAAAATGGIAAP